MSSENPQNLGIMTPGDDSVEERLAQCLLEKPQEPLESDCCGEGCTPCVFDIYEQELKQWEQKCAKIHIGEPADSVTQYNKQASSLQAVTFNKFPIESIKEETCHSFIFKFKLNRTEKLGLQVGQHIVLRWKNRDRIITRSYTPISDISAIGHFEVLIKVYLNGIMSEYVKTWKVGDMIEWCGPFGNFSYTDIQNRRVVMLAAGTGLAPMVQVIAAVLADDQDETRLHLLYCCQHYNDILLKSTLDTWTDFWNFSAAYLLSQESDGVKSHRYGDDIRYTRLTEKILTSELGSYLHHTCVLICGTKSFEKDMINYLQRIGLPPEQYHKF